MNASRMISMFLGLTLLASTALVQAIPLPDASTVASASTAFSITNTGTGGAGLFKISNAANANPSLSGVTNGTGRAGYFEITNAANTSQALMVRTNGKGIALYGYATGSAQPGRFEVNNVGNTSVVLSGFTNGLGPAGSFQISNPGNSKPALSGQTNGSGSAVKGIAGTGLAGEFIGNVQVMGAVGAVDGIAFGDGSVQQTAVHKLVISFDLGPGASTADIPLAADTPIQLIGICNSTGVRGVGQVSINKNEGTFVEWSGTNSESNTTLTHGYSGVTDTKIVQIDYNGGAWVVVGNSGGSGPSHRDTIRVKNFAGPGEIPSQRTGKVTLIW